MRLLKRIFWVAILAVVIVFAVANMKNNVAVRIDPLAGLETEAAPPPEGAGVAEGMFELPLPFIILGALAIGLLVGVMLENDRGRRARRELKRERRRSADLETELRRAQAAMKAADHPDSAGLPALRSVRR